MEAVVKIISGDYTNKTVIQNEIQYITNPNKTVGLIGGLGVTPFDPEKMIEQMICVKKGFDKYESGYRQIRHIVVSFHKKWNVTPQSAWAIAYEIAWYYAGKYQICFGIHQNTDNLHIHFIQNTVSYIDGKLFSGGPLEFNKFQQYVNQVFGRFIPECACSAQEFFGEG